MLGVYFRSESIFYNYCFHLPGIYYENESLHSDKDSSLR
ncbi:hypothetical protein EPIR_3709 [Erwinia piriflorinigrans CFBP 5888]|uniref:Uncharacterized protein n=1 Tax=Erwinia piriflorinigrans CFBP 5888 TaxID=1161919 RepID=V5ZD92_9GAMM|nr:hypothetical protein EPIR_3709 [Erwinia piriflorinigrans CFBP 5888]